MLSRDASLLVPHARRKHMAPHAPQPPPRSPKRAHPGSETECRPEGPFSAMAGCVPRPHDHAPLPGLRGDVPDALDAPRQNSALPLFEKANNGLGLLAPRGCPRAPPRRSGCSRRRTRIARACATAATSLQRAAL